MAKNLDHLLDEDITDILAGYHLLPAVKAAMQKAYNLADSTSKEPKRPIIKVVSKRDDYMETYAKVKKPLGTFLVEQMLIDNHGFCRVFIDYTGERDYMFELDLMKSGSQDYLKFKVDGKIIPGNEAYELWTADCDELKPGWKVDWYNYHEYKIRDSSPRIGDLYRLKTDTTGPWKMVLGKLPDDYWKNTFLRKTW